MTSNDTGETLFSDEFADASQWSPQSGTWASDGGRYVQSAPRSPTPAASSTGAYAKDWSNYTLELDATKLAGDEGFLVGFGATGANNYYWWNLGGWNNTRSVLQRASGGSAERGQGARGQEPHDRPDLPGQGRRRRHAHRALPRRRAADELRPARAARQGLPGRDPRQGHRRPASPRSSTPAPARSARQVEVADAGVEPTATVTTLSGAPGATNTKATPDAIKPRTREVSGISDSFVYEFPASSVTFIRMHTADAVAPVVDELSVVGEGVNGWYADPATVRVTATDDRRVDRLEVSVDDGDWTRFPGSSGT